MGHHRGVRLSVRGAERESEPERATWRGGTYKLVLHRAVGNQIRETAFLVHTECRTGLSLLVWTAIRLQSHATCFMIV